MLSLTLNELERLSRVLAQLFFYLLYPLHDSAKANKWLFELKLEGLERTSFTTPVSEIALQCRALIMYLELHDPSVHISPVPKRCKLH